MKTGPLRTFLEEFLTAQGATTERKGENLLVVQAPKKLVPAIGAKELVLAFNLRGVQEDPRSELGTVGNPVFDRILELARSSGRAGQRFEPVRPAKKSKNVPPDPQEHFQLSGRGVRVSGPILTYTPVYYVVFRIEYSLEDVADELEVVPLDGISLQPLGQTPELAEYWENLEREPAEGRHAMPAFPVPPQVIRAALRLLEKRLRKRLSKIRRESEEHLVRETESIENYYKQLIEETRNASRRWALPAGGREERIRLLQLDWRRRVEEAQQYWRPSLDVRLAAVGAAQVPRTAFRVRAAGESAAAGKAKTTEAGKKSKRGASADLTLVRGGDGPTTHAADIPARSQVGGDLHLFWDEAEEKFIRPPCSGCGTPAQTELVPTATGFLCPRCARLASWSGNGKRVGGQD